MAKKSSKKEIEQPVDAPEVENIDEEEEEVLTCNKGLPAKKIVKRGTKTIIYR